MAPHEFPRELAEHFGRNLLRARRRADYSQEELSAICDMHRTAIGLLENGARLHLGLDSKCCGELYEGVGAGNPLALLA